MKNLSSLIKVAAIPLFSDNYSYVVQSVGGQKSPCFLVDPAHSAKILDFLNAFPTLKVSHILYTHKHNDHIGKPQELLKLLHSSKKIGQDIKIIASAEDGKFIPTLNNSLFSTSNFHLPEKIDTKCPSLNLEAIFTPCHTAGHVLFRFKTNEDLVPHLEEEIVNGYRFYTVEECLFTGDTLFIGGCGRFFEGTAKQMLENMDKISSLPNKMTKIFCSHEYTKSNYDWASKIEKDNDLLLKKHKEVLEKTSRGIPTIPSTIADELATNLFARSRQPTVQKLFQSTDPIYVMENLRSMKNGNLTEIVRK